MIYLDYAATSWPKPPEVLRAMQDFLERAGGNPGRSGHRLSIEAGRIIYGARERLARFFDAADPLRVIFTSGATESLNLALRGLLRPGDEALTSSLEHNSMMRPLRELERGGVKVKVVRCASDGLLDPAAVRRELTPRTRLLAFTHASNVCGAILPARELAALARDSRAFLLLDAAQTAGVLPIAVERDCIDLLAFSGHKGLQGPPGTGGLVLGSRLDPKSLAPLTRGGTGSRSDSEEQPEELPDKFESGTLNGPGLAGLGAGVRWVMETGIERLREHSMRMAKLLRDGLRGIPGARVYGPEDPERSVAVVSFTLAGRDVGELGARLDEEHGILCRVGLHCAPAAHRTLGAFPSGTVRFAPGPAATEEEVRFALEAVRRVAG
jgi:cysteine desulfurase family protein